jgi:hypothetical protein
MRYYSLLLIFSATALYSQVKNSHFIERPSFQTGAIFQRWNSGSEQRLDEIVVPLLINYPVSERFSVSLLNTPTRAEARRAKQSSKLTAFTDTKISTALILGEERALLNFGVSIPSGPKSLEADETLVAQQITSHALAMPTSYFGGGVEASANLAAAVEAGQWVFGGSIGGVYKDDYVPISGAAKYRPGPEISVSVGFDRTIGERSRIFGDVGYTWYGKDQSAGVDVFQADGKIQFSLASILAMNRWQASFLVENRLKRKSPFALNNAFSLSYGNELDFSTELAREMNRDTALLAVAGVRVHGKNLTGNGDAIIASLGPGWRGAISPSLQMEAVGRFSFGTLNGNQILGGEASLGFALQF